MNKLFVLFFLALIGSIYTIGTPCGGKVKELRVTGCKEEPCVLKRGDSGTMEIDFTTSSDTQTVAALIVAKFLGREVVWPGMNKDGCSNSNLTCPLKGQTDQTYIYKFKVSPLYIPISTNVKISLTNDKKETEACYEVKVKVV